MCMNNLFPSSPILPGAVFHSPRNPHILFVVEEVARHAQDCSHPMVSFRNITPTRDAPAGTLWTLDKSIFRKRMIALDDAKKDLLWDGHCELFDEATGLNARRWLARAILCGFRNNPEQHHHILRETRSLWSESELVTIANEQCPAAAR